jgi:hypothetical protein
MGGKIAAEELTGFHAVMLGVDFPFLSILEDWKVQDRHTNVILHSANVCNGTDTKMDYLTIFVQKTPRIIYRRYHREAECSIRVIEINR